MVCSIRSISKGGQLFDQIYLNSSTWHPMHEICQTEADKKRFVYYKTMSYVGIYRGNERRCKSYENWSGTLDIKLNCI